MNQMFYQAHNRVAAMNQTFLELVADGLTREDLARCIALRPSLWGRFTPFLDKLPAEHDHA